jgi:uncharacterized cupredoxin-like copper-binding protein
MRRLAHAFDCRGALLALTLLAPGAVLAGYALAATAPQTVKIVLTDTDAEHMTMKADTTKVQPGPVTFEVTNLSQDQVHEMVIVRSDRKGKPLPYDQTGQKVIEEKVQDLGEVADLEPGKSGRLTLELTPGTYVLICNQPGHYIHGMKVNLVVAN